MPFDTFISYSTKDKTTADTVCAALESAGIRCWIAPRDVRAGIEYAAGIVEAIDCCHVMVLIFSASANASAQVHREIEHAFSKGLTIIPFRIEDIALSEALEYYLGPVHWLDAFTPPLADHVGRLVEQVKANLQIAAADPVKPQPPFQRPKPKSSPVGKAENKPLAVPLQWTRSRPTLLALAGIVAASIAAAFFLWHSPAIVVLRSAAFGGNGGAAFDDLDENSEHRPVSALSIMVNRNPQDQTQLVIGGLQVHWGSKIGPWHGGKGPNDRLAQVVQFAQGEKIGRVDVASRSYHYSTDDNVPPQWVAGLQIWTDSRVYSFGDMTFGFKDQCILGNGDLLLGFFGRSGVYIDQIGCIIGRAK